MTTQLHGILLRVGRFDNPLGFEINANIHLAIISGDNLQLEFLTSTNFRCSTLKCRICTSQNCNAVDMCDCIGEFRDDVDMQEVSRNLELTMKSELKRTNGRISVETKQVMDIGKRVGLKAGYNKLIDLFKWQNERGINGFFKSLAPDYLHTVVKGIIEDVIAWSMCCILAINGLDKSYATNLYHLDDRIKHFPIIQSLDIFPNKKVFRWFDGISHLFKGSWNSKGKATTGFFANGSIEGWKLPQLLFQLTFCINSWICPFETSWFDQFKKIAFKRKWNIGHIIINAMVSALNVHFLCRMRVLDEKRIAVLADFITDARAHSGLLRLLKEDLMTASKADASIKDEMGDSQYGGIKHHLLAHIPFYKKEFDADPRPTDTELSERAHRVHKIDFEHTNKQYSRGNLDMLLNHRKKLYINNKNSKSNYSERLQINSDQMHYKATSGSSQFGSPDILVYRDNVVKVSKPKEVSSVYQYKRVKIIKEYSETSNGINKQLATYNEVMNIADKCSHDEFQINWKLFKNNNSSTCCRLLKAVQCCYDRNLKSTDDYIIHCNSEYVFMRNSQGSLPRNICDFVEVKFVNTRNEESTQIVRVVSMFGFYHPNTNGEQIGNFAESIFLLVCCMKKLSSNPSVLPYTAYGYEIERSKLWFQMISIESVVRPAFLICHSRNSSLLWSDVNQYTALQLKLHMFYCVSYELVVKDYCDSFVEFKRSDCSDKGDNDFDELPINLSFAQKQVIDEYFKLMSPS